MSFRTLIVVLAGALAVTTACTNKKVSNPLAKVDSKQPDKVLFDRGMDAMKHNHFDIARLDMQTLINTYPESEFIARAKLALADSWYAEGGTAGLAQAEQEYRDFITFFPNMPEAAEAQLKIANIQFQQMEKPDRDFTHAVKAEQEYRQVILQYPDNQKMVAEARKKLLEVQEVIAEREYRVGRFYYLKPAYPAAIARLQSLVERYPLYSKADEALYTLGQSYEGEATMMRHADVVEREQLEKTHKLTKAQIEAQIERDRTSRQAYITKFEQQAAEAYSKILTRYPVMGRADDAKARLLALHQTVPRPTKAMLAQNKAEEDSRRQESMVNALTSVVNRHPDVSAATTVGDPSLQDRDLIDPGKLVRQTMADVAKPASGTKSITINTTNTEAPGANQPAPRSDEPASDSPAATSEPKTPDSNQQPSQPDPNELKPTPAAPNSDAQPVASNDPNELKPNVGQDPAPAQAPAQVNELQTTDQPPVAQNGNTYSAAGQQPATDSEIAASSKHKKKKGLSKIIPGK